MEEPAAVRSLCELIKVCRLICSFPVSLDGHAAVQSGGDTSLVIVAATGWLLDTNILSKLRPLRLERKVLAFGASRSLDLLYISIVTFAEIRFGIELVPDPTRRSELAARRI